MRWLPVFKKEMRLFFGSPVAYVVFTFFLLISGWFFSQIFLYYSDISMRSFMQPGMAQSLNVTESVMRGIVPGAVHIPRGNLESRIEGLVPDRSREIVVYCAGGSRSAFAAKALQELGYENVTSLTGGLTDWKRNGFPIETPRSLSPDQRRRYLSG